MLRSSCGMSTIAGNPWKTGRRSRVRGAASAAGTQFLRAATARRLAKSTSSPATATTMVFVEVKARAGDDFGGGGGGGHAVEAAADRADGGRLPGAAPAARSARAASTWWPIDFDRDGQTARFEVYRERLRRRRATRRDRIPCLNCAKIPSPAAGSSSRPSAASVPRFPPRVGAASRPTRRARSARGTST